MKAAGSLRIAVHDYCGHPFQVQLSRALAARGHTVLHAWCPSVTSGKGPLTSRPSDPPNFALADVPLGADFERYRARRRLRQELEYGRRLTARLAPFRPHVVLSANTPLLAQAQLVRWCRSRGVPCVFWQQDVLSIGTGMVLARRHPVVGRVAGAVLRGVERYALRRSGAVVAITDDFGPSLARMGVPPVKVTVIENWAPLPELPLTERDNPWRRAQGWGDDFVFLYSGTLGLKHDPALLASLAERLAGRARVAVVSEGLGAAWLQGVARDRGLANLSVHPFQPWERLPEVLGAADVLVAILERDAGVFSVPSKVLSYLCAGRPVLAALPAANLACRVLERAGAAVTVEPDDREGFLEEAERLVADGALRDRLGRAARSAAEAWFDIERITDRFESVLASVVASSGEKAGSAGPVGRASRRPTELGARTK